MGEKYFYKLKMIDNEASYEDYEESFGIGLFSSMDKAEEVAKRYLSEVAGFKDYDVTYRIDEKKITGMLKEEACIVVYIVTGWNINDDLDEVDIIESDCFAHKDDAALWLDDMKQHNQRDEWYIAKHIVDKCEWTDGFVRFSDEEIEEMKKVAGVKSNG